MPDDPPILPPKYPHDVPKRTMPEGAEPPKPEDHPRQPGD